MAHTTTAEMVEFSRDATEAQKMAVMQIGIVMVKRSILILGGDVTYGGDRADMLDLMMGSILDVSHHVEGLKSLFSSGSCKSFVGMFSPNSINTSGED